MIQSSRVVLNSLDVEVPGCRGTEPGAIVPVVDEETLYEDASCKVTTTRAIIGGTTYALANITSVKAEVDPAKRGLGIALAVIGGLAVAFGFGPMGNEGIAVGVVLLVAGITAVALAKASYHVTIGTAGGEVHALTSRDKLVVQRVTAALNEAIVKRG